ncbi:MAG: hypothetical protein NWE95_08060 [Candidatus Bathyarchaeota archaeon]|nr:hypothetical protein [Candidatus Bathyarchaeota archaeon]
MKLIKITSISKTIILLLMLTIIATSLPIVSSQNFITKRTYAYIGATPNPVGVGQETLIHVGITDSLEIVTDGWTGLTVTVTKPDGTTETLGPFKTDSTGGTGTVYIPETQGTYKLQTHFPAQNYTWTMPPVFNPELGGKTVLYQASDSEIIDLIVTAEPQQVWSGIPLPTEYWSRPIDAQLREWATISANWLAYPTNLVAPYNDNAPETAHILWAKPLTTGGLAGGSLGEHSFESGDAYEGKFGDWESAEWGGGSAVIINGILYYNRYTYRSILPYFFVPSMWNQQGIVAVDLRTGNELWFRNNTRLTFGQTLYWDSYNYHGVFSYLWEIVESMDFATFTVKHTWNAYDPFTGEWAYSISNVPKGNRLYGPNGEICIYDVNLAQGWIALWNSTKVIASEGSWGSAANIQKTFDGQNGYVWNKTIPRNLPGSATGTFPTMTTFLEDILVGTNAGGFTFVGNDPVSIWAINLKPGQEGTLLYNKNWTRPHADLTLSFAASSSEDRVFTLWAKEERTHYGFNMDTGEKIWGPTAPQKYLDIFGMHTAFAYGKYYSVGMSGNVYCYNAKTGALLWNYSYRDPLNEVLWSNDWSIRPLFFADGKLYLGQTEHSPVNPLPRGAPFICLDAETGEEVWSIAGAFRQTDWGGRAVIGDSIIATMDTYDQRVYAIGKGPSATTINAPDVSITLGKSVMIKGTVTDVSAGTKDSSVMARFPNGVAAVSDESMSAWMLYVYKQFPRPTDIEGVTVTLSVIDSNNNYREIGTATTDEDGFFRFSWAPDIPGQFTLYASFSGTKSYWPSHAVTAFTVDPEPTASPYPEVNLPPTEMYFAISTIAIIISIAIVGLIVVIQLKKRP